jgi:ribose transport system substrate-binding protein
MPGRRSFLVIALSGLLFPACGTPGPQGAPVIGFVVKSMSDEHWKFVHAGAMAAAGEFGVRVKFLAPNAETSVSEQTSIIENMIFENVSALCVAPSQPKAVVSLLNTAIDKRIPVLLVDTDAPVERRLAFIGTGNLAAGKIAGRYLASKLGPGAKVAIIRGALGDLTHDQRTSGAADELKAGGCDVIEVLAADSQMDKAMSIMEDILQTHEKVDAVFATQDLMALGAARAVRQSGRQGVVVVGFDGTPGGIQAIRNGELEGSVAQNPYEMGYSAVREALKASRGEAIPKRIDTGAYMISGTNVEAAEQKLRSLLRTVTK